MDKNGTGNNGTNGQRQNLGPVESKIAVLLKDLMDHPGFSELRMDVRFLKKGKKEVVLSSVKQYRFVVNQATNGITEELSRNSAGSKSL